MTKILKCPKCNNNLHSLKSKTECAEYTRLNVDEKGCLVETFSTTDGHGSTLYICPTCSFETPHANSFIADIDNDCEHCELETIRYNNCEIDVCQKCGLVLSVEHML